MEEIKKKDLKKFVSREIIYCIIYVVVSFILLFKQNTFLCGAIIMFIYAIIIDIDARISAERTLNKIEHVQNQHKN